MIFRKLQGFGLLCETYGSKPAFAPYGTRRPVIIELNNSSQISVLSLKFRIDSL